MERYKEYMDHITVPDELHEKIMRPKPSTNRYVIRKAILSVACCLLMVGLITMSNRGKLGETSTEKVTCAGTSMHEQLADENAPESQHTIAFQESGAHAESWIENDTIFPEEVVIYFPVVKDAVYSEDKTVTEEGADCWVANWQREDQRISLTLSKKTSGIDTPICSEGVLEEERIWDEITKQLKEQFSGAEEIYEKEIKENGVISFVIDPYEMSYTWKNMTANEVLECFKTIPYLQ